MLSYTVNTESALYLKKIKKTFETKVGINFSLLYLIHRPGWNLALLAPLKMIQQYHVLP